MAENLKTINLEYGWKSDPGVGMKNECPNCKTPLFFVAGSKKEVKEYFGGINGNKRYKI